MRAVTYIIRFITWSICTLPEACACSDGSDSDTEVEVMSVGSVADGEAVGVTGEDNCVRGVDDDENIPDTQQVDPRPLAGTCMCVFTRVPLGVCGDIQTLPPGPPYAW